MEMPEVGQVFGGYEFLRVVSRQEHGLSTHQISLWEVRCLPCGVVKLVAPSSVRVNRYGCLPCAFSALGKKNYYPGAVFGGYVILGKDLERVKPPSHYAQYYYNARCLTCSRVSSLSVASIRNNKSGCRGCSSVVPRNRGAESKHWKGGKHISGNFLAHVRKGARKRNIELDISIEYLDKLWEGQQGKCVYTGRKLTIGSPALGTETTASLDRIDSRRGYVRGNVQFVHKYVNYAKNDLTHEEFLNMCKEIANRAEA